MERRPADTMPLPVVETVASPGPPPTAAMPIEEPVPPPVHRRRDMTPWLLGLLAVAAVVALALSVLAFARKDPPSTPADPAGTETPTTVPSGGPPTSLAPPPTVLGTAVPRPTTAPRATTAPASDPSPARGKGKGEGKGKD